MTVFKKHIIIVGSARSGTSWLSETIARQHRYRMLFEPEHETRTKHGDLLCDKWIESETESPEAHAYLERVFKNRVDCDWIAQNSNRQFKRHLWPWIPKKFIIKFVRANLLAHYMHASFEIPIIHLIRNPYEVIKSQQRVKFPWLYDLSRFANQEKLKQVIFREFQYDISNYKNLSELEILTLRWCIENVIPLEVLEANTNQVTVIRYEDLFSNIQVFYDLCKRFQIEPISDLQRYYKQPSTKTHPKSMIRQADTLKKDWSDFELNQIKGILDIFKTELYSRNY